MKNDTKSKESVCAVYIVCIWSRYAHLWLTHMHIAQNEMKMSAVICAETLNTFSPHTYRVSTWDRSNWTDFERCMTIFILRLFVTLICKYISLELKTPKMVVTPSTSTHVRTRFVRTVYLYFCVQLWAWQYFELLGYDQFWKTGCICTVHVMIHLANSLENIWKTNPRK